MPLKDDKEQKPKRVFKTKKNLEAASKIKDFLKRAIEKNKAKKATELEKLKEEYLIYNEQAEEKSDYDSVVDKQLRKDAREKRSAVLKQLIEKYKVTFDGKDFVPYMTTKERLESYKKRKEKRNNLT